MINPSNKEVKNRGQKAERLVGKMGCVLVLCSSIGICLWPVGSEMGEWKEGIELGWLLLLFFIIVRTVTHGNLATVARNH